MKFCNKSITKCVISTSMAVRQPVDPLKCRAISMRNFRGWAFFVAISMCILCICIRRVEIWFSARACKMDKCKSHWIDAVESSILVEEFLRNAYAYQMPNNFMRTNRIKSSTNAFLILSLQVRGSYCLCHHPFSTSAPHGACAVYTVQAYVYLIGVFLFSSISHEPMVEQKKNRFQIYFHQWKWFLFPLSISLECFQTSNNCGHGKHMIFNKMLYPTYTRTKTSCTTIRAWFASNDR